MSRALSLLQLAAVSAHTSTRTAARLRRSQRGHPSGFIGKDPSLLKMNSPREGQPKALPRPTSLPAAPVSRNRTAPETLLPGFELRGDQADLVNARAAHDVDGPGHIGEQYRPFALYEGNFFRSLFKDTVQPRAQGVPRVLFLVDPQLAAGTDLHHDRLWRGPLGRHYVPRGLRDHGVEAPLRQRRNHHEDDDQHQQDINQRHDVHVRHRAALPSAYVQAHWGYSSPGWRSLYCPASSFAVIRPTLSMPEPRMMSMARATSAK